MTRTGPVDVLVAVPPGSRRPEPLIRAVAEHHPEWTCRPVWAGDPQLRPRLSDGLAWVEVAVDETDLLRVSPEALPWLLALRTVLDSQTTTIVLVCGSVAILAPVVALLPEHEDAMVTVPLVRAPLDRPALSPGLGELARDGSMSGSVATFGAGARPAAEWMLDELTASPDEPAVGRLFEIATQLFRTERCSDDAVGASAWHWPTTPVALLDVPHFDPDRPWVLDQTLVAAPRVSLDSADRLDVIRRAAPQLVGRTDPLRLPGGLDVDATIRRIARRHRPLPHLPWTEAAAFRRWLHAEYWADLHRERPDLQHVFPHPNGIDAERFRAWASAAAFDGDAPLLIDPSVLRASPSAVTRTAERRDGVNLVGYFKHQSGVANVGRRVAEILDRHGIPHSTIAYERTWNPLIVPEPPTDRRIEFANTLAFVNGDQFTYLHNDMPDLFGPGREVAGLWLWELETLEGAPKVGSEHADQIWAMTEFVARPFAGLGVPVHHVNIPFPEPNASERERSSFAPLAAADDRFVFGVVLDHLSITARKNPLGAIRAFTEAFAPGEGPMLVVKTINGRTCWIEHERLVAEAADRDDVVIWDELLPIGDHLALIGSFDALVSLHRSEGVGLHLAEAMWMERPVIATRYSGNLDFMDDDSALLVDATMVTVGASDGGWAYPASASWADPDLDQAATYMRRLVDEDGLARRIGQAARSKISSMPGEDAFVQQVVELLRIER